MATPRRVLVEQMAADLLRMNALDSEQAAMRALLAGPYRMGDVAILTDEALQRARQTTQEAAR